MTDNIEMLPQINRGPTLNPEHGLFSLDVITCVECGVRFAIDSIYHRVLQNHKAGCEEPDGEECGGWYCCPNGHKQRYRQSCEAALRDEVLKLRHINDQNAATIVKLGDDLSRANSGHERPRRTSEYQTDGNNNGQA